MLYSAPFLLYLVSLWSPSLSAVCVCPLAASYTHTIVQVHGPRAGMRTTELLRVKGCFKNVNLLGLNTMKGLKGELHAELKL